jgi:hypothetical protein
VLGRCLKYALSRQRNATPDFGASPKLESRSQDGFVIDVQSYFDRFGYRGGAEPTLES